MRSVSTFTDAICNVLFLGLVRRSSVLSLIVLFSKFRFLILFKFVSWFCLSLSLRSWFCKIVCLLQLVKVFVFSCVVFSSIL